MLHRKRRIQITALLVPLLAGATALYVPPTLASTTDPADCAHHLIGSPFEIDASANLKVNDTTTSDPACIDWLDSAGDLRITPQQDTGTGVNDDSFHKGASENDADPSIDSGSIPPNKSDLTWFGVNTEPQFLELFWARKNSPKGTTNMDFELNQKLCSAAGGCSLNGKTPQRTPGDKLITYDLSNGGTDPVISIRTWTASGWGQAVEISSTNAPTDVCSLDPTDPDADPTQCAIGSVNTSTIPDTEDDDIGVVGQGLDPFTFGEAAISFGALFPGGSCGSFGSAYLKSRSSDSFSSEIKDFVAPQRVHIANCQPTLTTNATASVTIGSSITDTATLAGATVDAGGTITFKVYGPSSTAVCTDGASGNLKYTSPAFAVSGNGTYPTGSQTPFSYTPTAPGTYYWIATYSGDGVKNDGISGTCGDANEVSVVNLAASTISTSQTVYPQDSATIGAAVGGTPTGSVTFQLFGPDDATCSGTVRYTETVNLTVGQAATANDTFAVDSNNDGTYRWKVTYGGDSTHSGSTSACGTERFTIAIDDNFTPPSS